MRRCTTAGSGIILRDLTILIILIRARDGIGRGRRAVGKEVGHVEGLVDVGAGRVVQVVHLVRLRVLHRRPVVVVRAVVVHCHRECPRVHAVALHLHRNRIRRLVIGVDGDPAVGIDPEAVAAPGAGGLHEGARGGGAGGARHVVGVATFYIYRVSRVVMNYKISHRGTGASRAPKLTAS